jgi:toxin ParE1/3/4
MPQVVYSAAANEDLSDIAAYIAPATTIREKCSILAKHPMLGEERPGFGVPGCRCFSVGNYVVFFRPIEDGIEVARIVHGSRDLRNFGS